MKITLFALRPILPLKNVAPFPSGFHVSEDKSQSFNRCFPIRVISLATFMTFVFSFLMMKMNLGTFCFRFTQLYFAFSFFLPNLGNLQPLFLVIFFQSYSLSVFLGFQ